MGRVSIFSKWGGCPLREYPLNHRATAWSRGEHTEEILTKVLGYSATDVAEIKTSGAITPPEKPAKAEAA